MMNYSKAESAYLTFAGQTRKDNNSYKIFKSHRRNNHGTNPIFGMDDIKGLRSKDPVFSIGEKVTL